MHVLIIDAPIVGKHEDITLLHPLDVGYTRLLHLRNHVLDLAAHSPSPPWFGPP